MSGPNTPFAPIPSNASPASPATSVTSATTGPTGAAGADTASERPGAEPATERGTEPVLAPGEERVPLPSGAVCILRPGRGRDLLAAQRMAGNDPHQVMYGLIAALGTFDGQRKVLEDVLDMPLGDVMALSGKIGGLAGGDFLPSTTAPSSTSQP